MTLNIGPFVSSQTVVWRGEFGFLFLVRNIGLVLVRSMLGLKPKLKRKREDRLGSGPMTASPNKTQNFNQKILCKNNLYQEQTVDHVLGNCMRPEWPLCWKTISMELFFALYSTCMTTLWMQSRWIHRKIQNDALI